MSEWQDHLDMQKSDAPCDHCRQLVAAERAARVAAEGALAALRERIEAAANIYAVSSDQERIYGHRHTKIGRNDIAGEAYKRSDADALAARTLRALLDSPDAGAKGEAR